MGFGNDGPRHWNNGMFGQLGYAVPWWGDNHSTISQPIHRFTDVIGKNLLGVMTMSDARVSRPPQRECLETIAKLCYRGRDVLNTRLIRFSDKRTFRPRHATPIPPRLPDPSGAVLPGQERLAAGVLRVDAADAVRSHAAQRQ